MTKILSIVLCILAISCMSGKILEQSDVEKITFGTGGGFTNEIKSYTLTSENILMENAKEIMKIDLKKTQELFIRAQELMEHSFMEPGNMYSFIEIKSKEKTNRIVWAHGSTKVDKKVDDFHKTLMAITK
jgi:hypothetical protein